MKIGSRVKLLKSSKSKFSGEIFYVGSMSGDKADLMRNNQIVVIGIGIQHLRVN